MIPEVFVTHGVGFLPSHHRRGGIWIRHLRSVALPNTLVSSSCSIPCMASSFSRAPCNNAIRYFCTSTGAKALLLFSFLFFFLLLLV
ncbi:hypothetical protein LY78DRAFT_145089 [Colletotrichum sublineola]|nr:hypothetical protein LY78DRAFT_145089 [Colletotrichum sublineola]